MATNVEVHKLVPINLIFQTLSDDKSLVLLDTIALSGSDFDCHIAKLGLTNREYYSRIRKLRNSGLITRENGIYSLSSLGKIVSSYLSRIGIALDYFWKLKALDSLGSEVYHTKNTRELYTNLVEQLIDDVEIKEILMTGPTSYPVVKPPTTPEIDCKLSG